MAPLLIIPALALLLCPVPARANDAREQAGGAAIISGGAVTAGGDAAASQEAARPFDGNAVEDTAVVAPGVIRKEPPLSKPTQGVLLDRFEPPLDVEKKPGSSKLKTEILMAGAAILGGLQGGFSAGLLGAVAGAGLGLAAAWLFHQKDYGGAFGVTAGAIIGAAMGGPIGSLVGAAVGGVLGHFLGKIFL